MNHPLIIGAGGVASYLLPVLLKTFRPQSLTIIDKDVLEERNLDRQLFHREAIGTLKAQALIETVHEHTPVPDDYNIIEDWFSDSTVLPDSIDAIICVADNHEARKHALQRADDLGIRAYIGGNEYVDSQAFVYHPDWRGGPKDPRTRYPNIETDTEGSPLRCTGDAQIAHPQLAVANLHCAAKLLHLLWIYERHLPKIRHELTPEALGSLPHELYTSLYENSLL